jgi:NaMN:DMB phosphoribosyltransferase/adenosyl cobinamide kinase/adenosyl cobinamide phosphate guanylyltransferase
MALPGWRTALVLGGAGSGRSDYAATLLSGAVSLRRVLAGAGDDLAALANLLRAAKPDDNLLIDGLDGFLPGTARGFRAAATDQVAALTAAVRDSPARVVIVSPDAGGPVGGGATAVRQAAEAVGGLNRAVAGAVDAVVLVVAGQPLWLDGGAGGRPGRPGRPILAATDPAAVPPMPDLEALPQPHAAAGKAVATRLAGSGLGALVAAVSFAAAAQGSATPRPWESVRLFILSGDHPGAAAAGAASGADRSAALRAGAGALALLADHAATTPQMVECAPAAPIEHGAAATSDAVEQAFARGYAIADRAVDEGADVLALGSLGDGADTAAAAVTSLLGGNAAEPAGLLGRVRAADGTFDDAAWIRRCAAVRDAVRRVRRGGSGGSGGSGAAENRPAARTVLAELGGADIATATGVILGAAARRTPVLLDGPVGAAAALAARGLATPAGQWCLLVDHGGHPTAVHAADQLRLTPLLDLRLDLGEGAAVLAALPLLRLATALAATALAATALSESTPARTEA